MTTHELRLELAALKAENARLDDNFSLCLENIVALAEDVASGKLEIAELKKQL
jgi:hypothetical protein